MRPNIDFGACLKDSPGFRASLEEAEDDVDRLEIRLEKVVKLCNSVCDAGKTYNNANKNLLKGIDDLRDYFRKDDLVATVLQRFSQVLCDINKYNAILLEQTQKSLGKNINTFVKSEIRKVKDQRKHFEKISDDMDQALIKHSQAQKSKLQECEETKNVQMAMKTCFAHTSLDYVFHMNVLHERKRFDVLDTMLSYMNAHNTFFHQGHDLFRDHDAYMKSTSMQLKDLNNQICASMKSMEERHTLVQKMVIQGSTLIPDSTHQAFMFKALD